MEASSVSGLAESPRNYAPVESKAGKMSMGKRIESGKNCDMELDKGKRTREK